MASKLPTVALGDGLRAGKQGLGCMGLSPGAPAARRRPAGCAQNEAKGLTLCARAGWYGDDPAPQEQAVAVIRRALASGASLLSTAHFYGAPGSTTRQSMPRQPG